MQEPQYSLEEKDNPKIFSIPESKTQVQKPTLAVAINQKPDHT